MCAPNMITKTHAPPPQHACHGKRHLLLTLRTHRPNTNPGASHQIQDQPSTQVSNQAAENAASSRTEDAEGRPERKQRGTQSRS